MSCDRCDKPAAIHVTEVARSRNAEKHLCEACALEEGIAAVTIPADLLPHGTRHTETGRRFQRAPTTVIWKTKGACD